MAEHNVVGFNRPGKGRGVEHAGGPPHNGDMEARISKLEAIAETTRDRLAGVETRLTVIEQAMATKEDLHLLRADLHKEINAQTWKLVTFVCGFGSALVAAVYFIAKHAS
ncbi:hypothetical protein JFK97_06655 [Chromobacterium phragmitis]|uniref:hypothetical protein n=1 Tax=Chromobacterium amazonense TaxID=1382803 RepID=UPI0021B7648B|nr:hypothetical protein [Chromobacterium amazonense]MBM2884067.1 hypothetical protein [Chromobacterium amazonense]